jgi:hypothetical protein
MRGTPSGGISRKRTEKACEPKWIGKSQASSGFGLRFQFQEIE